jgi:ribosomal protein S18 acetylase RimI-like enzyme
MNLAHDVSKQEGFNYCTLITHRENNTAQNLYKNLGYDLHYSDDVKDFYFLEL